MHSRHQVEWGDSERRAKKKRKKRKKRGSGWERSQRQRDREGWQGETVTETPDVIIHMAKKTSEGVRRMIHSGRGEGERRQRRKKFSSSFLLLLSVPCKLKE